MAVATLALVAGGIAALRWRAPYEPLTVVAENTALGDRTIDVDGGRTMPAQYSPASPPTPELTVAPHPMP